MKAAGYDWYWCDYGNVNASNFPNFGGNYDNGDNAGCFNLNFNNSATETNTNIGSRISLYSRSNCGIFPTGGEIPAAMPLGKKIRPLIPSPVLPRARTAPDIE